MTDKTHRILSLTTVLALMLALVSLPAFAGKAPKVDVCHVTGSGSVLTLNVSANALPAHLGHGDFLPLAFYADADGDGYGDAATSVEGCGAPAGFVEDDTDCDDTDAAVNPGATEIPGNGIDDDCNPYTPDELPSGCPCSGMPEWDAFIDGTVSIDQCFHHSGWGLEVHSYAGPFANAIYAIGFCEASSGGPPDQEFGNDEEIAECFDDLVQAAAAQRVTCDDV